MSNGDLNQITNFIWGIADDVLRDLYVRGKYRDVILPMAADAAYRNARLTSDKQNARTEHNEALKRLVVGLMKDDTELFKQFSDNESFRRWLADTIFCMTYDELHI